jgi:hypothetical protein
MHFHENTQIQAMDGEEHIRPQSHASKSELQYLWMGNPKHHELQNMLHQIFKSLCMGNCNQTLHLQEQLLNKLLAVTAVTAWTNFITLIVYYLLWRRIIFLQYILLNMNEIIALKKYPYTKLNCLQVFMF